MGVDVKYYVIAGYDLTGYKADKYKEWKWSKDAESFFCFQKKGYIQLFDAPMDNSHLYLGYVLGNGYEYDFPTIKIDNDEVLERKPYVLEKLKELVKTGVISKDVKLDYKVIVFAEYS